MVMVSIDLVDIYWGQLRLTSEIARIYAPRMATSSILVPEFLGVYFFLSGHRLPQNPMFFKITLLIHTASLPYPMLD